MLDIEKLREIGKIKKFQRDEHIFHEGDKGNEMFIILSGKVEVYINSLGGFPISICNLGPADFFGEMSLLENLDRSASVVALEDTTVISINSSNFHIFISEYPSLSIKLMKGLSNRIRNMDNEIKKIISQSSSSKLFKKSEVRNLTDEQVIESLSTGNISKLFPPGHKKYNNQTFDNNNNFEYLLHKSFQCPVCEKKFDAELPRISKLKLSKIDFDSRVRYIDFEPLWYMVLVCPECLYANLNNEFNTLPQNVCSEIYLKTKELKGEISYESNIIIDINSVFMNYYLAIFSAGALKNNQLKLAKLWLHLTWLYEDVQDNSMVFYAAGQVIDNYYSAFFGEEANAMLQYEAEINLILGELFLKRKDTQNALKHYRFCVNSRGEDNFKIPARNRIKYLMQTD